MKFINNLYDKYLYLCRETIKIRYKSQLDFIQKFQIEKNITSIIEIGCDQYSIADFIQFPKEMNYLGIFTNKKIFENHRFNQKRYPAIHQNSKFICKEDSIDTKIPNGDLYIIKNLNYLDQFTINRLFSILEQKKFGYIVTIYDSANLNNIEVLNGLYKPINLSQLPFNYDQKFKLTMKLHYYDKWLTCLYVCFLCSEDWTMHTFFRQSVFTACLKNFV